MCFMSDHRRRAVAGRRAVAVMVVASVEVEVRQMGLVPVVR